MTRIVARAYYVLETDRHEYRLIGCECGHFESLERVFSEMASWQMHQHARYRDVNTDAEYERVAVIEKRLARLLAFWHRGDVQHEPNPEIVICAAIRLPDGRVIRGHRHSDCIATAVALVTYQNDPRSGVGGPPWEASMCREQGFVTSRNRYVDRYEAMRLQVAAGIPSACGGRMEDGQMLLSEDLY